jgi:hypothetical protein
MASFGPMASRGWPLFHYTSATTALDHILVDAQLQLGPTSRLNDPYESEPHWVNFIQDAGEQDMADAEMELFTRTSDLLREGCRLTCLTESRANEFSSLSGYGDGWTRARMWAQYADHHSGVCLAFDQERLFEAAVQVASAKGLDLYEGLVQYRAPDGRPADPITISLSRARADLPGVVQEIFPSIVRQLYFSKTWDWFAETEYRLVVRGEVGDVEHIDIRRALTAIFLGSEFPRGRLDDVLARCQHLIENRILMVHWRNGFPVAVPLMGPRADRIRDRDAPPPPAEPG